VDLPAETFRLLVESVQDYAIYLLAPDGTIRSWNAGAERLKGYTASEIIGDNFARFFGVEDRAAGRPAGLLARALSLGHTEDVGWRYRKDGSRFWASAVITTLRDASGTHVGFAKVTRDLTERGYRAFVEASHAIVWTTSADGMPNADSPSWRKFTGQTAAEWFARRAWDPVHPDDLATLRDAWTTSKATGARFATQFRLRRFDGEYVWMEANAVPLLDAEGQVREWFGVTFDISARKLAELQTERALELWRTTLRSIGDAVISTDATGHVRFMNPIAERLTGWTAREAEGLRLHDVFPIFHEDTGDVVENPSTRCCGKASSSASRITRCSVTATASSFRSTIAPRRSAGGTGRSKALSWCFAMRARRSASCCGARSSPTRPSSSRRPRIIATRSRRSRSSPSRGSRIGSASTSRTATRAVRSRSRSRTSIRRRSSTRASWRGATRRIRTRRPGSPT
jgi:PAS domain S-box-containing protein